MEFDLVKWTLHLIEAMLTDMKVIGGGRQFGVAQELLERHDVNARLNAMRCIAVTQAMDSAKFRQPGKFQSSVKYTERRSPGKRLTWAIAREKPVNWTI